ncbi:MAG: hypothetical protein J6P03_04305, partial [Opitutales bacterium]|nr:hypothetical protein [Opitutales bacterium]
MQANNLKNAESPIKKAKELLARGDVCAALQELKLQKPRAVSDYNFALKLSKTAAKIIGADSQNSLGLKKAKIALLSSSSTNFLEPLLGYFFAACDINAEARSGGFGNWKQDILNPNSWLADFSPDAVIIAANYRDAPLKAFSEDPEAEAAKIADDFESLWRSLKMRAPKA